ncbi:MAG: FAD-dependent oxidoreductase [Clostridiales bacterium]|jgi:2,4-dienoyl-CoA reductase-like NADH-dependent reductase (Old Yellow Enzyme family)/thioredoxin reductase|nr:FAD-dependent oxidoreductase [Clostridiales bacterium]
MGSKYKHVFSPIRIRGVDFKNRIELAPPSLNLASLDHFVTQEFVDLNRSIAYGGAAVITVGNVIVDISEAADEERQLELSSDDCIIPLSRFAEMCEGFGAHASLEINHIGQDSNFAKTGRRAYAASSYISERERYHAAQQGREPNPTIEMTKEKIKETVEKYAMGALRAKRAGMKMCMVHGGHGNLISQFSSPLYNFRKDEYGGSLENRARFCIEVLDRTRELVGEDFVIEFRISADEIHPDGMHFDETLKFIELICDKIDILHVSAGLHGDFKYFRYWYQNHMMAREYNVHYAADIKKAFPNLLVNTVGSIMSIDRAEYILSQGWADFVSMCRPLLADPEMPRKYAEGREGDHRPCLRCQYCGARLMGRVINCAVNPFLGNEREFPLGKVAPAPVKKRVAVIGAGPAGITAVQVLCDRGHDVTLYEKTDRIGGALVYAAIPEFKQDIADYVKYLQVQAAKAPAKILLNTECTKEILDKEKYDAVIVAIGAEPIIPDLSGIDKPHVHWAPYADAHEVNCGDTVVIAGAGAVGIEAAIDLAKEGKNVTVIEMAENLRSLSASSGGGFEDMMNLINELKIPVLLNTKLAEVTDDSVICLDTKSGETKTIPADTVLLAIGVKPRHAQADTLRRSCPETSVFLIGDCLSVGNNVASATMGALKAAAYI